MYNNLEPSIIKSALEGIIDAKMLSALFIKDDKLNLVIEVPAGISLDQTAMTQRIEQELYARFKQLKNISIIFSGQKAPAQQIVRERRNIPNIKKIILFASAKGGVGKSTTATNVAIALAKQGFKTGLVDADIYGPTIPKLLGINQKPEISENMMLPIKKHGIYSISIGYLIEEAQAAIWRGPMISKTLYQLLLGVKWPELDYLIIDMPPGTGDIYLSLAENFKIDGVVLLTMPQNISFSMVKKSISFFNKTNISILGVVENMSYFIEPNSKLIHNIFGESQLSKEASNLGIEIFEKIPIITKISDFSDSGKSIENEDEFLYYSAIAKKLSEKLKNLG